MKTLLTPIIILMLFLGYEKTPTKQITGTITSAADGLALPDVKVQSMPSKTSVVTNANGKYSLKAPNTDTYLLISYLGFKTQNIKLGKQNVIDIKLEEDIKALNEVAVVGYGVAAKRSITSSVSTVKSISTPAADALGGRVAGVSVSRGKSKSTSSTKDEKMIAVRHLEMIPQFSRQHQMVETVRSIIRQFQHSCFVLSIELFQR